MRERLLLLFLLILSSGCLAGPLEHLPCLDQVNRGLKEWHSENDWRKLPDPRQVVYLSPTGKLGTWIRLESGPNHLSLYLLEISRVKRLAIDPKTCRTSETAKSTQFRAQKNTLDDSSLRKLVKSSPRGIIYAWSPHMPLSLEGVPAILSAAREKGIPVIFVLDPHASAQWAETAIRFYRMPTSAGRRIASLELFLRGLVDHFPSVVTFSQGKLDRKIIPGLKSKHDYDRWLATRE